MSEMRISDASLQKIIVEGDPEELVGKSEQIGEALAGSLKTSQIRNIFGTMRQIQMGWPPEPEDRSDLKPEELAKLEDLADRGWRQLLLLIPKLRYQAGRKKEVKPLADVLEPAIRLVQRDRDRFQRFAEFFEAILAHHTAAGGKS
jgi:CRISPR type III-A/MTUBE-associated protein Csm2